MILNLQQATFRLQKFLLMLQLIGKRFGNAFFIMNEDATNLGAIIKAGKSSFAAFYVPGVISNYAIVGKSFYNKYLSVLL